MTFLHPRTRAFFSHFARAYPTRSLVMATLLLASGILEGLSVITLVPLLEVAADTGGDPSRAGAIVRTLFLAVGAEPTLGSLLLVVVVGITLKAVVLWLAMRQVGYTVAEVMLDLRRQLVRALCRARWDYVGSREIGAVANSAGREVVRSATAYREGCVVVGSVLQVVIYLVASTLISWQVTVAALVTGAALLVGLRGLVTMGRAAGDEEAQLMRSLSSRLVDSLKAVKAMKAMAREDFLQPLLEAEARDLDLAQRRSVVASESLRLFQEPVVALVLGVGLALLLTWTDQTFTSVLVLAFVFQRLMAQIHNIQSRYQFVVNGEGHFWSLRAQIDGALAAVERHSGTVRPTGIADALELRGVSFSHGTHRVLDGVTARIPARRLTALIGESGSGKSTVLDIVVGLRRPDSGDVYVDGVPLEDLDLTAWRSLIGYVPQEGFLFADTIRNNITLGDPSIPDERVEQALRDAGAWEFVHRDPLGIQGRIRPQGSNLSGGQRQRLTIARALVKGPALLVLDEATTGLDAPTERAILDTLVGLRDRVTILAVSHQPALREVADVVLELREGAVVPGTATRESRP